MVYVVHNHTMRGPEGTRVPKYDFSEAEQFGEVRYLIEGDVDPEDPKLAFDLSERLKEFTADDYLLLVGSPVAIGLAFAIASEYTDGKVKVLQWSGRDGYRPISIAF